MANIAEDIRSGDVRAFEMFYRLEFNKVVHFIASYTSDRERSRDLAQEVLCLLWEKRALIKPDSNLRSWVYTIARNRTLNALKEKKLFSDNSVRDTIDERVAALEDPSMEHFIDSLELTSLIRKAFETLPDTSEDTFRLSRIAGLTNREIAERKGISVKSVEYHIKISLRHFRKKLKEYLPEGKKY